LVSGIASAWRVLFTVAKMCVKPLSVEVVLPGPNEYGKNSILRWELKLAEGRCECKFWLFGRLCIGMSKV
jgi:hypothetical protein